MGNFGRIKDKQRIDIQSVSCLKHDSLDFLEKINCPTFIIGAEKDDVLGVDGSLGLHQHIKDSQLTIFPYNIFLIYTTKRKETTWFLYKTKQFFLIFQIF